MTTDDLADAKRATDAARTKVRRVLMGARGLDGVDRDDLESAMVALDWVRSTLGEAVAEAAGGSPSPRAADLLVRKANGR